MCVVHKFISFMYQKYDTSTVCAVATEIRAKYCETSAKTGHNIGRYA